jgi:hypothetical protein
MADPLPPPLSAAALAAMALRAAACDADDPCDCHDELPRLLAEIERLRVLAGERPATTPCTVCSAVIDVPSMGQTPRFCAKCREDRRRESKRRWARRQMAARRASSE